MNHTTLLILTIAVLLIVPPIHAQDHEPSSSDMMLTEPGEAIFGAVQEVIRQLEANPSTDWSTVDMEALRQHLIDMREVARHVEIIEKNAIHNGVLLIVRPTTRRAEGSLERVLDAHPAVLQQETGWTMNAQPARNRYVLRVTTPTSSEVAKLRALGFIGLLAYGDHHQHHHWLIATGQSPHHD